MIFNLKLFIRNLWRNKLYSIITVLGFALSLMFVILLSAYIRQELSVDEFHVNKDRIFRAVTDKDARFGSLIGEQLKNKYPEIECYTRVSDRNGFIENANREKIGYRAMLVDPAYFKMFSFRVLDGNVEELFHVQNSVVLTQSYALKIFGEQAVIGKVVDLGENSLIVTGVVEDLPDNTHFDQVDMFLRFDYIGVFKGDWILQSNAVCAYGLYVMAAPGADLVSKRELILEDLRKDYWVYKREYAKDFDFESLTSVYWGGKAGPLTHGNNKIFVFILMAIVVAILVLALINYNNLSVARVGARAKEAAIRKLVGITNRALFRQFVTESVGLCLLAFLIAVGLAFLVKPLFNDMLDTTIDLAGQLTWVTGVVALCVVVCLGFVSGIVPAWMITCFNPVDVVKGVCRRKVKGTYGKLLICFQYIVSIVLIVCTLVIIRQTNYLQNYNLGFDKENVIWMQSHISSSQTDALRSELMKLPEVKCVSFVQGSPLSGGDNDSFVSNDQSMSFQVFGVDSCFFNMMNISVRRTSVAMSPDGVYLNETGVKELGLEDLPTQFKHFKRIKSVLGVVSDFHFRQLSEKVGPAMIVPLGNGAPWEILVKVEGHNVAEAYRHVTKVYSQFIDNVPFSSKFMDDAINEWYASNERQARLIGYFAGVSVVLSIMGILAMATYYISQRVKEVGIRRVNGATVNEVLRILIQSFMKWVGVAFVLACPVAWYVMNRWLEAYPYRIDMGWWLFVLVGIGVAGVALLMVGWQSIKVATTNPVDSLKSE